MIKEIYFLIKELLPVLRQIIGKKVLVFILYTVSISVLTIGGYKSYNLLISIKDKISSNSSVDDKNELKQYIDVKFNQLYDTITLTRQQTEEIKEEIINIKLDNKKHKNVLNDHLIYAAEIATKQDLIKVLDQIKKLNQNLEDVSDLKKNLNQLPTALNYNEIQSSSNQQ